MFISRRSVLAGFGFGAAVPLGLISSGAAAPVVEAVGPVFAFRRFDPRKRRHWLWSIWHYDDSDAARVLVRNVETGLIFRTVEGENTAVQEIAAVGSGPSPLAEEVAPCARLIATTLSLHVPCRRYLGALPPSGAVFFQFQRKPDDNFGELETMAAPPLALRWA